MKTIQCHAAQKGFAAGPAAVFRTSGALGFTKAEDPAAEKEQLDQAFARVRRELKALAAKSRVNAKIIEADEVILEDEAFTGAIYKVLEDQGSTAEYAVQEGCRQLSEQFQKNENAYIRERSDDIQGLGHRLIAALKKQEDRKLCTPSVVIADEMTPGVFAELDQKNILALVTVRGAMTCHVSIMCGNLGIPCLYGLPENEIPEEGTYCIADGDTGTVIFDPDADEKKAAEEKIRAAQEEKERLRNESQSLRLKTRVCANISNAQNLEALKNSGADGVGLFRTEFLFLDRHDAPMEDEQYEIYRSVLEAMEGKEVVIRTMDIGSDKKAFWLDLPAEKNPQLGNRGVRISLTRPEIFRVQLRALLRAAVHGKLKIMFPMIASEWEVDAIRQAVNEAADSLKKDGIAYSIPPLGIMIETPAAAVTADRFAPKVDFFSVGTNDLVQYTTALDREAAGLEKFYAPKHEAVFRLVRMAAEAGHRCGIETAICGELGSDEEAIPQLIQAGVDELSVPVSKILKVRDCVRKAEETLFYPLASPCSGDLILMKDIPDPVFASGSLGQAIGIRPEDGEIYAPFDGKVVTVAPTLHALTLEDASGSQLLIHIGIDTVKLNGTGFEVSVKQGDSVREGQLLARADLEVIKKAGYDTTVVVVRLS